MASLTALLRELTARALLWSLLLRPLMKLAIAVAASACFLPKTKLYFSPLTPQRNTLPMIQLSMIQIFLLVRPAPLSHVHVHAQLRFMVTWTLSDVLASDYVLLLTSLS